MTGYHQYELAIDACLACASICNYCASSCTKEPDASRYAECIQHTMECAVICYATAELMSLGSMHVKQLAKFCATICDMCAEHCRQFSSDHCQECAAACTKCAEACEVI
ncbi:MAG: four-helix bundle copper-binding protein [Chitinophagaceae bacterium]|nr:MAG: four-helix bundle copper-binding protein [Chitinophagaceae bacterium]